MMNRENSRTDDGDLVDIISDLPDLILSHILSYLPTKNAVATTILSKRWRFMWMKVVNLDLSHDDFWKKQDEHEDMVQFVNHILLHAEFLTVSETLQYMELNGNSMSISDKIVVSLPRLETLKLVSVFFKEDTFFKLISGSPMLNYLHIDMDVDELEKDDADDDIDFYDMVDDAAYLFCYRISSTSLRRLELSVNTELFNLDGYMRYCALELEASSLEYIKLVGFISRIIVLGSVRLRSLVEADLQIKMLTHAYYEDSSCCNSLVDAVRAFDCAKALSLSRFTLCVLSRATVSLSTVFKRLTKLEVGTDCCCGSLQDFIQSSYNLEVLTIYQHPNCLTADDHVPSTWTTPVEVPRCLSNSLKVVVVEGYGDFWEENEMIGYMLKHGSVLEVMEISCAGHMDGKKFELLQQICKLPRKSPACSVNFLRQKSMSKLQTLIASDIVCMA